MYDVVKMKHDLNHATQVVGNRIKDDFKAAFRRIYEGERVPEASSVNIGSPLKRHEITSDSDIDKIVSSEGFYILLTNYPVQENTCRLHTPDLRAVYRGECTKTRQRVMSHLSNSRYHSTYHERADAYRLKNPGKQYHEDYWPHCLKLEPGGASGINVNQEPYSGYQWLVLVHPMRGSSRPVRQLAEEAFDELFNKPAASREKLATSRRS
ncbi:hypothetical protein QTH90_21105 [Variovorax sp. J2P1-59]|uniref:hypothetical protein n=1 Tax=Variovorax flavidus TaxID=3053501 RepID=UPI002576BBB4|nr:hypothetical protein [Variovorax sp. J2P1-59]MDM0076921.1 hypothetical protein [Variovorax sp. J2P1-59]